MNGISRSLVTGILTSLCWSAFGQSAVSLDVDPVYQQTPVWCWAAVGEMVFRYYGVENINPVGHFQCGIVALLHPVCNVNCGNCLVGAGSIGTMNQMLTNYPRVAGRATGTDTQISTSVRMRPLSLDEVKDEIDAGRPIVAGISPSGYRPLSNVSEHVALIVGYDGSDLLVNDPFPFLTQFFASDPYLSSGGTLEAEGQYRIPYRRFVSRLRWQETIYNIVCRGDDCASNDSSDDDEDDTYGHSCCSVAGRCGPFPNQPSPIGESCWCATIMGPAGGSVCRP